MNAIHLYPLLSVTVFYQIENKKQFNIGRSEKINFLIYGKK